MSNEIIKQDSAVNPGVLDGEVVEATIELPLQVESAPDVVPGQATADNFGDVLGL